MFNLNLLQVDHHRESHCDRHHSLHCSPEPIIRSLERRIGSSNVPPIRLLLVVF